MNATFGPAPAVSPRRAGEVAWLVDHFAACVPNVLHAVLVASNGLMLAASKGTDQELGERLSASTSSLLSLAQHGGDVLNVGRSEVLTFRLPSGHLLAMRADESACLMVVASVHADVRIVANEMLRLVDNVASALAPQRSLG